jgi:hypothetical protein
MEMSNLYSYRQRQGVALNRWKPALVDDEIDGFPLRPIWPGFAINTVLYAAILYMLLAAPFALRRWRRIKRGLCPKCGYDLRGRGNAADAATCPECGGL